MNKIKLAVIFGGKSSEYPVSLHSTASLLRNIDETLYDVLLVGISSDGVWQHFRGTIDEIEHDSWFNHEGNTSIFLSPSSEVKGFVECKQDGTYEILPVDCIFPVLHGKNGEDGTIQGLFELSQIPYVGPGVLASSACMDKEFTHILCENAGIAMAKYMCLHKNDKVDLGQYYQKAVETLGLPIFIKPANAGSSFGISKIRCFDEFEKGIQLAFEHDSKALLETTIDGFEIGCAVMGNDEITVGCVDEIDTKQDFFDYEGKYDLVNTTVVCPARISEELTKQAQEMARLAYTTMGCKGMTRVDMFVTKDNRIVLNELNTIPGFTDTSRYPSMMKGIGIDFKQLIQSLVTLAMNK